MPDNRKISSVLSEGERRCRTYRIVNPVGHISHRDMLDKIRNRADESGVLRCYICGSPITDGSWHLDHVRPLVAGGNHELRNVEPAHARCNLIKSDKDLYTPPLDDFVPLLDRLKAMPVEDLFKLDPELANRVLVAPRPVPIDPAIGGMTKVDDIVRILASQPDPYRSMTLTEIQARAQTMGIRLTTGELSSNHWLKVMDLGKFNSNDPSMRRHNNKRTAPSSLVAAVRVRDRPGEWGVAGFRLRFSTRITLATDGQSDQQRLQFERLPVAYPDHDEIDRPQPPSGGDDIFFDQTDDVG